MDKAQSLIVVSSFILLLCVLELVRRRQLREEYSWLWLLMSAGYFLAVIFSEAPIMIAEWLGSSRPYSLFSFLAIFFLVLICIQFSVRLSRLTNRNKYLAQQLAILDGKLQELSQVYQDDKQAMLLNKRMKVNGNKFVSLGSTGGSIRVYNGDKQVLSPALEE